MLKLVLLLFDKLMVVVRLGMIVWLVVCLCVVGADVVMAEMGWAK